MVIFDEKEKRENSSDSRKRVELTKRLINLTRRNGYEIIQTNGQRVYAPPASRNITPPTKGCEVFIGKLHKNVYEDELIPLFEKIGPLFKFRLMLDFTERTRGYAFATYFTPEDANRAVIKLNNYEVRPRLYIGVYKSVDNCRLFIGNLPEDKKKADVTEMLNKYVEGVVDLIMYPNYEKPWLNRGFVFVEFENHRMAAMARRQFTPDNLIAWGQPLYVDWADPLPDVDPKIMSKVTILYLRNVPLDYSTEEINTCVCNVVGAQIVKKVHKTLNYAFVHFVNRNAAEIAKRKLQNFTIGNYHVGVEWARPRRFSKKSRLSCVPENFCTSVPPNLRRLIHQRLKTSETLSQSSITESEGRNPKPHQSETNFSEEDLCDFFGGMSLSQMKSSETLSQSSITVSEGRNPTFHQNMTNVTEEDMNNFFRDMSFSGLKTSETLSQSSMTVSEGRNPTQHQYMTNVTEEDMNDFFRDMSFSGSTPSYQNFNTKSDFYNFSSEVGSSLYHPTDLGGHTYSDSNHYSFGDQFLSNNFIA